MSDCVISADNLFNCSSISVKGIAVNSVWLYNFADWKAATLTQGENDEITAIANDSSKQSYEYSTSKGANIQPNSSLRSVANGDDQFTHQIVIPITGVGAAAVMDLEKLIYGRFVAIVMLKQGIGLVYGANSGLRCTAWNESPNGTDNGGSILITASTPEDEPGEVRSRDVIDAGDYSSTLALIESTKTPGT